MVKGRRLGAPGKEKSLSGETSRELHRRRTPGLSPFPVAPSVDGYGKEDPRSVVRIRNGRTIVL